MKELRMIIRELREDRDIKQKVIAEYLGVSQQTYSNYENGHREIPICNDSTQHTVVDCEPQKEEK